MVHKLHEKKNRARRDSFLNCGKVCAEKKYAKLRRNPRNRAEHLNKNLGSMLSALRFGKEPDILLEDAEHLRFCLECLDNGKTAEAVPKGGGIGFVSIGYVLFLLRTCFPVIREALKGKRERIAAISVNIGL